MKWDYPFSDKIHLFNIEKLDSSSVKISEAFEFETETAVGWRSDLPENVIWQVDSLQI